MFSLTYGDSVGPISWDGILRIFHREQTLEKILLKIVVIL